MSLNEFRRIYERHIGYVAAGDTSAVLADMVQAKVPAVFDGVDLPRGKVCGHEIKDVRADGEFMVGETVYDVGDQVIGLRSIWENHDGRWLAAALENFPATAPSGHEA